MVATIAAGTSCGYYLQQSEYYLGGSEPAGRWVAFDDRFGVGTGDQVEHRTFERLHAALGEDGAPLVIGRGNRSERVNGYDVTLSAPKSVSVAWALAVPETRCNIEIAQTRAVDATLKFINDEAAFCRRGRGGASLEKVCLVAAVFQHGESRPAEHADGTVWADPQLHSHAVILNLAQRDDGSIGALDGRMIFANKMAAGAIYHAQLAAELNQLGFEIEPAGKNGIFEISGVDKSVAKHFSARREAIMDAVAEHGLTTDEAPQFAAAITAASRTAKSIDDPVDRHDRWRLELGKLGHEQERYVEGVRGRGNERPPEAEIVRRLSQIPRQMTETESVFERRHIISMTAGALVGTGVDADRMIREVDRLISSGAIVVVGQDALGRNRYSTPEMIDVEREICSIAARAALKKTHHVEKKLVARIVSKAGLSSEQVAAINAVTSKGAVVAMEGAAGSGKSTTLKPIVEIYQHSGFKVIGSATAWRTANGLRDELGIDARATDSWIASANNGKQFLDEKTLLIVDEAGQLSSRPMNMLLQYAERAKAKLLLVGDREQLQPIGPGAALGLVAQEVQPIRIDTIVRQREIWARKAAQAFSKGDSASGLAAYASKGLLVECEGPAATIRSIASACVAASPTPAPMENLVIAKTNAQVLALNQSIRDRFREIGSLRGPDVSVRTSGDSGRAVRLPVAEGDQIRFRGRNDLLGVVNGTVATIETVKPDFDGHALISASIEGRRVSFNTREIQDAKGKGARLEHAYASTFYSIQGTTSEQSFVLIDPSMTRHDIYVAVSRARGRTHLYYDLREVETQQKAELPLNNRPKVHSDLKTRRTWLAGRLSRSHEKATTIEFLKSPIKALSRTIEMDLD